MVTGDQELQWAYLLCPTFELSNSEGKPLTNGYIELYIAGTRDKYYAASDFNGTLHPFQIPLDSLGANIVLVNPGQAYDVYVYNRFGNLVMSRYNVTAVGAGSGSGNSNFTIDSSDGTVVVTTSTDPETGVKTYDLSVPSVSGDASYWMGRGAATMGVNIEDTEYHDIQISSNSIRNEGEDIEVLDGKFSLKEGVYFWSVTVQLDKFESFANTRQKVYVESTYNRGVYTMDMTHDESETVTFSGISVADHDGDTEGFKIKSEGTSPIRATLYHVAIHKLNHNIIGEGAQGKTYTGGDYIQITDDDVINVTGLPNVEEVEDMIESAITATASGYVYTAGDYISIDNREISVTGLQPEGDYLTHEDLEGYATETYVDNNVSSFVTESTVTSLIQEAITGIEPGEIYVPGQYVEITDENVINVTGLQPAGEYLTQEDLEGYATETYVDNSVSSFVDGDTVSAIVNNMVTALLPPEIPLVAGDGITITETEDHIEIAANVTSIEGYATESYVTAYVDNSTSDFTTHTEVNEAIVTAIQTATGAIPDQLEAGEYISIVDNKINVTGLQEAGDYATHADVYEAIVTGVQAATGEIPDVSDFATHTEVNESAVTSIQLVTGLIPDVTDFATHTEVHDATVTAIETVTAMIPEAQVQSDWTEDDTADPSYIQHKPDEYSLVAGQNIGITLDTLNREIVIAASGTDLSGCATKEELQDAVELVTGLIPDAQVQSNWAETDNTDPSYIQNKPNEYTVVAGNNIGIMIDNNDLVISASGVDLTDYTTFEDVVAMVSGVTGIGDYGQFYATDITGAATMSKAKGTIDVTNDGKIKLSAGQSYHVTVRGRYVQGTAANTYTAVSYIEYVTNNSINFNVDKTKTDSQYFELSYDLYKLNSDTNYYIFFTGVDGLIKDLFIEIHAIGSVGTGGSGGSGVEYDAGWGIRILNNIISVNPDVIATVTAVQAATGLIPDVSDMATKTWVGNQGYLTSIPSSYATDSEVYDATVTAVQTATGLIPDVSDFMTEEQVTALIPDSEEVQFEELDITQFAQVSAIPVVTGFATKSELSDVEATIPTVQLNGSDQVTAINNHPLAGGGGGGGGSDVTEAEVYDATVTAVQAATGAIPDVSDMATKTWVGNQGYLTEVPSTYATDTEVSEAIASSVSDFVTESEVTALIPDTEDVDFEELDITSFALASAVPTVQLNSNDQVTAINNHEIAGTGGGTTYTAGDYISIDNNIISVTGVAPVTAIPESEDVDFEELDITSFALASAVPTVQLNSSDQVTAINDHPIAGGGGVQVQSDWAVTAVDNPAYIQNKPTEKNLIAGANVTITESNDEVTIETTEIASGLQLVAGKGVTLTVSGTQIIAGLDETVLYTANAASDSITTSEEVTHFERLRIELQSAQSTYVKNCLECKPDASNLVYTGTALIPAAVYPLQLAGVRYTSSNGKNFTFSSATRMCYKVNSTYGDASTTTIANSDIKDVGFITKIVGINRISS